jgi:hypothetical protein
MMKTLSQRRFVEYASYVVSDSDFDPHIAGHLESERVGHYRLLLSPAREMLQDFANVTMTADAGKIADLWLHHYSSLAYGVPSNKAFH